MTLGPGPRKLLLTVHLVCSLGWLGAVAAFLALAITGLTTADADRVRAAYLAMPPITWSVIVPLALGAVVTGLVQGLGTPWGLFRHYWVLAKLVLTLLVTALLLVHTRPIEMAAEAAARGPIPPDLRGLQLQLVGDSGGALAALLLITTLGVVKPRGQTGYGQRREPDAQDAKGVPAWFVGGGLLVVLGLVLFRLAKHHSGGHFGHH